MSLIRAIEVYDKISEENILTVYLSITPREILTLISDLVLNADDSSDELFDPYILTKSQVDKLLEYVGKTDLLVDTEMFIYELNCYESSVK